MMTATANEWTYTIEPFTFFESDGEYFGADCCIIDPEKKTVTVKTVDLEEGISITGNKICFDLPYDYGYDRRSMSDEALMKRLLEARIGEKVDDILAEAPSFARGIDILRAMENPSGDGRSEFWSWL